MPVKFALEKPAQPVTHLYFVEAGLASMTSEFRNGTQVEVGLFGRDSAIGFPVLTGMPYSLNNTFMQIGGHGFRTTVELARAEFLRTGEFHDLLLQKAQVQLVQTAQTAACNARHALEQRMCRWLLMSLDRMDGNVLHLTQEFLAMMLGVERPAVSVTAGKLQEAGLIEYRRGQITVLNRDGMERLSCECYGVVRDFLQGTMMSASVGR